jgi:hypothetical protein
MEATLMLVEVTPGEPLPTLLGQVGTEALAELVGVEDVEPPGAIGEVVVTGAPVLAVEELPLLQAVATRATETITTMTAAR